MKEGWEYKTLGEVGLFISGYTPKKNELNSSSGTPYFKVSDMNRLENQITLTYSDLYIKTPKKIFPKGSIVFPKNGGAIYTEKKRFLSQDSVIDLNSEAIFADENYIIKEYLFYFLSSIKISSFDNGGGLPSININRMKECSVPLPNIDEQRRIVSYLDSSFKLIDEIKNKALKSLTEAKALFQSALAEAMEPKEGWEEKTFGEICTYHKEQKRENGYKYIGMENIESGTGNLIGYGSTDNVLSSTFFFKKGEVLYGRLRPYLKKVYIAEFDGCCSTEIFPIKTNGVLPGLIKYWFLTDEITNKINDTSAGCRMPRGNMNEVLQFHLYIPSDKQSQKQIVSRLDKLSSKVLDIEEKYQKMVDECDALKQAMLRDVFE